MTFDFYHSTLQSETNYLANEKSELSTEIKQQLTTNFFTLHHRYDTMYHSYLVDTREIEIQNLKANEGNISFVLLFPYLKPDTNVVNIIHDDYASMNVTISSTNFYEDFVSYSSNILSNAEIENINPKIFNENLFFPSKFELEIMFNGTNIFICTNKLAKELYNFIMASNGRSSNIKGNFWRMFYLSAITITTVGYGDIVPLTTRARILVSVEAILGVVLIGLFINSVGNKIKNASG